MNADIPNFGRRYDGRELCNVNGFVVYYASLMAITGGPSERIFDLDWK